MTSTLTEHEDLNEKINSELYTKSITDSLTAVFNKRYFQEYSNNIEDRERNFETSMALLILDIDYFKLYNDCYGHLEEIVKIADNALYQAKNTGRNRAVEVDLASLPK